MNLKNLIPLRYRTTLIRQFGQARLVKLPNGQHELIGGTDQDRSAAFEWASLLPMKLSSRILIAKNQPAKPSVFQGYNQCEQLGMDGGKSVC